MSVDDQKRAAGEAAAKLVEDGMTVGLGTGSTAVWFVRALGGRVRDEGLKLRCVATGRTTEAQAAEAGLAVSDLDDVETVDLTVDGADEVGPELMVIKGGGGALLREKLVWTASKRIVIVADASKRVARLGAFPLPVEVVRFGHRSTATRLHAMLDMLTRLGAEPKPAPAPVLRMRAGAPFVTDSGNVIYDLPFGPTEPGVFEALCRQIKGETGVVEQGLFVDPDRMLYGMAQEALIATDAGVERIGRSARPPAAAPGRPTAGD